MSLTLIAALDLNNGIGKHNQLLWHLPDDFAHFKQKTVGHTVIMGRKTFESLPKMLPNRTHIILSREKTFQKEGCIVVSSIKEAIKEAHKQDQSPFVIGGGEVYHLAMPYATILDLTRAQVTLPADTFFSIIDTAEWELVQQSYHPKDQKHCYEFYFETYIKK